ncbi:hypothetical protein FXN59_05990 [Aggregatibacter actinomycetemcomitans]|nr:hypothetical protein FXN59_05990 [Aggregatibacter actinomycetemcomitans]
MTALLSRISGIYSRIARKSPQCRTAQKNGSKFLPRSLNNYRLKAWVVAVWRALSGMKPNTSTCRKLFMYLRGSKTAK